ncbi:MAG: hypothetical protein HYS80_01490, partial [Candidatus Aenigmarchaeota archaeon]|nr:hypothetical protein [Candidatus Aenigmarchaeota archaeon]
MLAKRHPWPVEAFGQNIHRLVGLYEAGLAQFTSEPDMADLGESIAQGRLGLSLLEEGYRQNLGELE